MDHPGRREERGKEVLQNADCLSWSFEVGVTETHSEFSLVDERALGVIGDNLFKAPQGFFDFTPGEKDFPVPEKQAVLGLGLGQNEMRKEKHE